MVSKVAVTALVIIVACPILLGYAMNLNEVTETDYRPANDSINVTNLLQTGTGSTYARGNLYTNNTNFAVNNYNMPILPIYNNLTTTKTSFPLLQIHYPSGTPFSLSMTFITYADIFTYAIAEYTASPGFLQMAILDDSNVPQLSVPYLHTVYFNNDESAVYYTYYVGGDLNNLAEGTYVIGNENYVLQLAKNGGDGVDLYLDLSRSVSNNYVDIPAGYYFETRDNDWFVKFPSRTRSVLLTVDLGSITDANYNFTFGFQGITYKLTKSTNAGVVSWNVFNANTGWNQDIYYDNSSSNNTYQIYFDFSKTGQDGSYKYYRSNAEFRYVGTWPSIVGAANVYNKYTNAVDLSTSTSTPDYELTYVEINQTSNNRTPTLRVDNTEFRAFDYMAIKDKSYVPSNFKTNPITTISGITVYGQSITFGGNTYQVDKGNITIGSRSVPVEGLQFISTPNPNGYGYINKIGKTEISLTAIPSEIVLTGEWSASISTASMESYTYTKTEWTPGQFAWNGIDQNFTMIGLLAAIGAFIALGIAYRKAKSALLALLVVCGGAVVLFFTML